MKTKFMQNLEIIEWPIFEKIRYAWRACTGGTDTISPSVSKTGDQHHMRGGNVGGHSSIGRWALLTTLSFYKENEFDLRLNFPSNSKSGEKPPQISPSTLLVFSKIWGWNTLDNLLNSYFLLENARKSYKNNTMYKMGYTFIFCSEPQKYQKVKKMLENPQPHFSKIRKHRFKIV